MIILMSPLNREIMSQYKENFSLAFLSVQYIRVSVEMCVLFSSICVK